MWIKSMSIERSRLNPSQHILTAETKTPAGVTYKCTLAFDNDFFHACEAFEFLMIKFAEAHGHVRVDPDGTVVPIAKKADRVIPAKYLKNFTVIP